MTEETFHQKHQSFGEAYRPDCPDCNTVTVEIPPGMAAHIHRMNVGGYSIDGEDLEDLPAPVPAADHASIKDDPELAADNLLENIRRIMQADADERRARPEVFKILEAMRSVTNWDVGAEPIMRRMAYAIADAGFRQLEPEDTTPPVGAIFPWPVDAPVPNNWCICNGGDFDSTRYPQLFEVLGSVTLPDLITGDPEAAWRRWIIYGGEQS